MAFKEICRVLVITTLSLSLLSLNAACENTTHFSSNNYIQKELRDTVPGNDTAIIENGVYKFVDTKASFPDGVKGMIKFLERNANPNTPVEHGAREGKYTVRVQFTVDTSGMLSDFKVLTQHGYGMEQEVMKFLQKSPPWIPAVKYGRKVKSYVVFPFTFEMKSQ